MADKSSSFFYTNNILYAYYLQNFSNLMCCCGWPVSKRIFGTLLCLVLTQFKVLPHSWGLGHLCLHFRTESWRPWHSLMGFSYSSANDKVFTGDARCKKEKNIRISKIPSQWKNNWIFWSSPIVDVCSAKFDWMDIYQGKTVFFVYFIYICVDLEF